MSDRDDWCWKKAKHRALNLGLTTQQINLAKRLPLPPGRAVDVIADSVARDMRSMIVETAAECASCSRPFRIAMQRDSAPHTFTCECLCGHRNRWKIEDGEALPILGPEEIDP